MYIPEKLKLNKFVPVAIPSNRVLFQRFGFTGKPTAGQYSGDTPGLETQNKIESIAKGDKLNQQYLKDEESGSYAKE